MNWIEDYINNKNTPVIHSKELLNELLEYSPKPGPMPKFNSDEYWDMRCRQAKAELARRRHITFFLDKIRSIGNSYLKKGVMVKIDNKFILSTDPCT